MKAAVVSVVVVLCTLARGQMMGRMGEGRMMGRGGGMMGTGEMMGPGGMMGDAGETLIRCKRPMCDTMCEYGMKIEKGCPTCECQANPCEDKLCEAGLTCQVQRCNEMPCEEMFSGVCVDQQQCPEVLCMHPCPLGFKKNEQGCQTCGCKSHPCEDHECPANSTCVPHKGPCLGMMCHMMHMTGICVPKELEKPRVVAGCPVMNCMANMYCEFGHQVDEKGCTTCACKDDPCENVVSICDRNGNILDCVESCRTPTWVSTPFKEWISLGCNELYMKVKHRVAWNRLCNGRRSPEKWRTRHFPGNNKGHTCAVGLKCAGHELDCDSKDCPTVAVCRVDSLCKHHRAVQQAILLQGAPVAPTDAVHVPQCTDAGAFNSTQCHAGQRECWCVDEAGQELDGSRRPMDARHIEDDQSEDRAVGDEDQSKESESSEESMENDSDSSEENGDDDDAAECPVLRSVSARIEFTMVHTLADITVHIEGLKQAIHEHVASWMMIMKEYIVIEEIRPHSVKLQHIVVVVRVTRSEHAIDLPSAVFNLRSKMQQHVCSLHYAGHLLRVDEPDSLTVEHNYVPVSEDQTYCALALCARNCPSGFRVDEDGCSTCDCVHKVHPLIPMMVFAVGAAILVLIVTIAAISMLMAKKRRRVTRNGQIPQWKQNLVGENLAFPNQLYEELEGEKLPEKKPLPTDDVVVDVKEKQSTDDVIA